MEHRELPKLMLPGDTARNVGVNKCWQCGSRKVVYFISYANYGYAPGAYCYRCMLRIARATRMIPFPIEQWLLDSLKLDMGLSVSTPATHIFNK